MHEKMKNKVVCFLAAAIFAAGFLLCLFLPKEKYSYTERRVLAPMPEFSGKAVWSGRVMSGFESYAVDAFPFRDAFRRVQALTAAGVFLRKDNHGVYFTGEGNVSEAPAGSGTENTGDGYLLKGYLSTVEYPMNEASLAHALQRFRHICETYLTEENKVYLCVIPDKNCFLARESGHPAMDYEEFERQMAEQADFAEMISVSDLLEKEDYYRTDTHWRQERITDVAGRLAASMGTRISETWEIQDVPADFYGVYYGQAALPVKPDTLRYLTNEALKGYKVYDWQNGKDIPVYDMERAQGRDPYEMFLSGSLSLLTIENPMAEETRELVVFRDSFGSAIAPLLASGYSRVTLVDIRYIQPDRLGDFVDFSGCDVLFLYSTLVLNHSETLK